MSRRKVEGTAGKEAGRRRWTGVARGIVWLRFLIVPIWVALAVAATLALPSIFNSREGSIGDLLPANSQALNAERSAERTFGVPLLTRTVIVASEPGGLSRNQVAKATRFMAKYDQGVTPSAPVRGAFPLANVPRLATQPSAGRTLSALYSSTPPGAC